MTGKIPYYSVRKGFGYWQPTAEMKRHGFVSIACGPDTPTARRMAEAANTRWQDFRRKRMVSQPLAQSEADAMLDRTGNVYFLFVGDRVKIGYSRKPFHRISDLMVGLPTSPRMVLIFRGRPRDEKELHARFAAHRVNGEWFRAAASIQREIMRFSAFESLEMALRTSTEPEQSLNGFRERRPNSNCGAEAT